MLAAHADCPLLLHCGSLAALPRTAAVGQERTSRGPNKSLDGTRLPIKGSTVSASERSARQRLRLGRPSVLPRIQVENRTEPHRWRRL
jgi:hypothetical protein